MTLRMVGEAVSETQVAEVAYWLAEGVGQHFASWFCV
jgi:hypothetical protein